MSLTMSRNLANVARKQKPLSLIKRFHQPYDLAKFSRSPFCHYANHQNAIFRRNFQSLATTPLLGIQASNTFKNHARFLYTSENSHKDQEVMLRINPPHSPENEDKDTTTKQSAGVAILTLNRPKAANAMGSTMLTQLHNALTTLSNAPPTDVRCVVLTSATQKVFSAGADLKERSKMTQEEAAAFVTRLRGTFDAIELLGVPVIAAVEGVALGGGLEIALTADILVAGKNAKFGLPETGLAIIPGAGGTQRLPRRVGTARAKDLIYTGRRIDADTAYEYGLVQHVVDAGAAEEKALELAHQIAQKGPLAIRAAKTAINKGCDALDIKAAMEIERQCYQQVIPTSDRLEGLAAFREGRKPVYKGE